jgi:hypothetical protein
VLVVPVEQARVARVAILYLTQSHPQAVVAVAKAGQAQLWEPMVDQVEVVDKRHLLEVAAIYHQSVPAKATMVLQPMVAVADLLLWVLEV